MQLKDGLCSKNKEKNSQHLKLIGYDGPVCFTSDQTVSVKSLQVHNRAIVVVQGGDVPFVDEADLTEKCKSIIETNKLCAKV